jgi:CDP-paratose synthetase
MDILKNKKVLVSGGTGFLGSYLTADLLRHGALVHLLVRKTSSLHRLEGVKDHIQLIHLEESYEDQIKDITFDYFFHLAICYGRNSESMDYIYEVNLHWPLKLLKIIDHKNLTFVNFGTSLPAGLNDYTCSKYQFKEAVKFSSQAQIIHLVLEQFFGPNDGTFLSFIIGQFANGAAEVKLTEGGQKRDFIYYKDVLSAITVIINSYNLEKFKKYEEFSIGTGSVHSIREVVEMIKTRMNNERTKLCWGALAYRPSEVMNSSANPKKLLALGWRVQYNFSDALAEVLESLRSEELVP